MRSNRRKITGVVVSRTAQRTVTVRVDRLIRHARYGKYVRRRSKFMAHDAENTCRIGDTVSIIETRPLSKRKRWAVREVLRRAPQAAPGDGAKGAGS